MDTDSLIRLQGMECSDLLSFIDGDPAPKNAEL
jgi:hypothetical protein